MLRVTVKANCRRCFLRANLGLARGNQRRAATDHHERGIRSIRLPSARAMASRSLRWAGSSNPCVTNPSISASRTSKQNQTHPVVPP